MIREDIINTIERIINEELDDFNYEIYQCNTEIESFMINTAIRLCKTYSGFKAGMRSMIDVMASLRNFMIVFQTSLQIDSLEMHDSEAFGIYKDNISKKYYASYDVDELVKNETFIKDAFINKDTERIVCDSKYQLKTNGFIKRLTNFEYFKSVEQKLCVYGALNTPNGFTTLVSMPTGGGKSLVTQAVGYSNEGLSIVIVPTVSLAMDQERVSYRNIKIAKEKEIYCYYSNVKNAEEIFDAIKKRTAKLLFISPEALIKNDRFRKVINDANSSKYLKNIIIDEAHIVVSWGDFFRIDYQCLGPWRRELLKANPAIRTFLLSATFKDDTVSILKYMFATPDKWIELRCDALRKEPRYILVKNKNYNDKKKKVIELVDKLPRPAIIYVNNPFQAKQWKKNLEEHGYANINLFTGETRSEERKSLIRQWANNEFDIMIATSAFGVGVDKPDVRTVMHLYVPDGPDSYYQELGRGGRDGLPSLSIMCITDNDIDEGRDHIQKVLRKDTFWGRWWSMYTNPSNQWSGGQIAIMASTKPNYNKINYFEEGNDTDEKWNINVLLLLSRYKAIDIIGLDLDDKNRYIFTVKILDDLLTFDSDESKDLFEKIRNEETKKAQSAFNLIKNSIYKSEQLCWSGMFTDTYTLVSECCSGCNSHTNKVLEEKSRFPLLLNVSAPAKKLSKENEDFFAGTNEALIISKDNCDTYISKYKPNIIICDDYINVDVLDNPELNIMNFAEFRDLKMRDNEFYISGLIMVCYSEEDEKAKKQYGIVNKYIDQSKYVIHIAKKDFRVSDMNEKKISDCVSGAVIEK